MNRISSLRKERGWNQDCLANLLNVKRSTISKYETEMIPLTKDTILLLTKIFDVSSDYLLGNSENKNQIKKSISDDEATEILKNKFIKHGIIKDGDDLTTEQLDDYLKKLSTFINTFKN